MRLPPREVTINRKTKKMNHAPLDLLEAPHHQAHCTVSHHSSEVTVTSVSLSPFMSHRGLFNTNPRLSPVCCRLAVFFINPSLVSWSGVKAAISPAFDLAYPESLVPCSSPCSVRNQDAQETGRLCVHLCEDGWHELPHFEAQRRHQQQC